MSRRDELVADRVVQGWPCQAGIIWFDDLGRVEMFSNSEVISTAAVDIPVGSLIELRDGLWIEKIVFKWEQVINGVAVAADTDVVLHPNGGLHRARLPRDCVIAGVECTDWQIAVFDEQGDFVEVW